MPDLFSPVSHSDGQQYTAAQVNRLENGLEALDVALDSQTDRIDALYASGGSGGGSGQTAMSGTLAVLATTAPSIGTLFLIKDDAAGVKKLVVGTGSEWINPDGSAVAGTGGGTPGTSTAPVLSSTVTAGGTIGQINLTWTAVSGATAYNVYELESPNGVSGATGLTTTSSTRTPSTARNYEYWITAIVGGVESAASNHIQALLPYTAPGGGGGGTSSNPSTFLNINGLGTGTGGWWNLGIGYSSGHTDIQPDPLKTFVESPYYTMNSAGTGVQFQVFMNGGRTSANTKYPRSELREYATGSTSTKASWNGASGRHIMRGRTKVMHYAPIKCEVCIAQIHDSSDDALQIRAEASSATGSQTWRLSLFGTEVDDLISGVALGTEVKWEIDLNGGDLTIRINDAVAYTNTSASWASSGNYFKVGDYPQQNSTDQANSSSEYSRIELRDLFVSHS